MSPSAISTNDAWALCAWADTLYVKTNPFKPPPPPSPPPPPWNAVFVPVPPTIQNSNMAAIVQDSGNLQQYALVIQGTTNIWDALLDFGIDDPSGSPLVPVQGAEIAQGASTGLSNVLSLTNTNGQTLQQYLQDPSLIDWSTSYLFLAGHSLGGTLASLLAPWAAVNLFNQQQPVEQLPAAIKAITFAAYAAGNQQLADFLDSNQPHRYHANFNKNDVVPHVWATAGYYSVHRMYRLFPLPGPSPMPSDLECEVKKKTATIPPGFNYVQTNGKSFTVPSKPTESWVDELSYQHNNAYAIEFGTGDSSAPSADAA